MTQDSHRILKAAVAAVDPYKCVAQSFRKEEGSLLHVGLHQYDLAHFDRILLVAFGKASAAMACAVVEQLGPLLCGGLVIIKDDHATTAEKELLPANNISIREASHPVPDSRSVQASQELIQLVQEQASEKTLVVTCISGGGSALFCLPEENLSLDDLAKTNQQLLNSGLSIQDMNVIRKRLEVGKGGGLAMAAFPSTMVSLVMSDVLGDPLDLIASGPTVEDTSSSQDALTLIERSGLSERLPSSVVAAIERKAEEVKRSGGEEKFVCSVRI